MAEPLKTFFDAHLTARIGGDVARVHPGFDRRGFVRAASRGLDRLELLDRARHIARTLAGYLPAAYPDAIEVLLASLGPEHTSDELVGAGLAPFYYLPHVIFVSERGLEHFELSMRAQHELTRRFTAEFSIRAFLESEPERTLAVLEGWTQDPSPHVRRLVSEGTRLRLPWATRVRWLEAHPERIVALLERLKDDPSTLVRRSVANNLNDLARVHPELAIATCRAWLADPARRPLVEHALRGAVRRGDRDALALLGFGGKAAVRLERVRFDPPRVAIGGQVLIAFTLRGTAKTAQDLLIDVAVHFVKARGASRKVFKLTRIALPPRGTVELSTRVSLAVHTTRVPRAGTHAVDVLVNGTPLPAGAFEVVEAPRRRGR